MPKKPAPRTPGTFNESAPAVDEAEAELLLAVKVAIMVAAPAVVVGFEDAPPLIVLVVAATALTCVEVKYRLTSVLLLSLSTPPVSVPYVTVPVMM